MYVTPLICASKFDSFDACRVLIQNGAQITKKTCNGQSPLHYAARKGHTRVLEVNSYSMLSRLKVKSVLKIVLKNSKLNENEGMRTSEPKGMT